ncbi:MAG: CubicO group peptidase (beta-lactamase class C family) [Alcanivorax sp.]|jgi:CubicO group peptidase (beta-lactamase class C family)
MTSWIKYSAVLLVALTAAVFLTYYQPWAKFSPAGMNKTFLPGERIDHFRNMDRIYPSQLIRKGKASHQWPNDSKPLELNYSFRGQELNLDSYLERTVTTGLLVIKDGVIVNEQYRFGETEKSLHTSWSVAKSFVATLVGMALDDGKIGSIDDRIEQYIPELKGRAYGETRIKDVLQMSSGIDFDESYGKPGGNTAIAFSDIQWVTNATWIFGVPINALIGDYKREEKPGTRWEYRSSDTQILGWLVEKAFQQPFVNIIEERLWQPMGMEADANWLLDGSGVGAAVTFCCLNATLRDFARLGELYRLGGSWQGQQLLSQEWISAATIPDSPHLQPEQVRDIRGYQYQWWVPKDYDGEYFASGIWGQNIWVDEKHGVVIARTAVDPDFQLNKEENIVVLRAISKHFGETVDGLSWSDGNKTKKAL